MRVPFPYPLPLRLEPQDKESPHPLQKNKNKLSLSWPNDRDIYKVIFLDIPFDGNIFSCILKFLITRDFKDRKSVV